MMSSKYYDEEKNKIEQGVLYVVGTPIGNMSDISERALKILSGVDHIAAEDTRNTGKLLSIYGITQDYISYHEHNKGSEKSYSRPLAFPHPLILKFTKAQCLLVYNQYSMG